MTPPLVLSVSQVEKFDPEQLGGCQRRWWFEDVRKLRPESTAAHEDGHQGHRLLAHYLATGERPGRVRLGKAVNAVIDAGRLPRPGPHLQVEHRFSGQPSRDASGAWVPLDASRTLWQAGHPWEGFVDLRFRRGPARAAWVWDHKFSSDIHARALPAERLIRTVQMPIYALDTLRQWPEAAAVNLVHLYVSRQGVESFIRHQQVSVERVHQRAQEITVLVHQMDVVRVATVQDDVPFNRAACHARMGCPHQFRCNAFKRRGTTMDLNDEEKAMFGMLSEAPEKPAPARVTEPLERPAAGRVTPALVENATHARREDVKALVGGYDPLNLDDIFEAPVASTPLPQPAPTCEVCGEVLTPENSSRLKTGDVKHIVCSKAKPPVTFDDIAGGVAERLADTSISAQSVGKCSGCPHPAHDGKRCDGRRGKGQCRCGESVSHTPAFEAGAQPQRPPVPAAPKHTPPPGVDPREDALRGVPEVADYLEGMAEDARQLDREEAAQRLGAIEVPALEEAREELKAVGMDPEAVVQRARAAAEARTLPQARSAAAPPFGPPSGNWSGALAVNVTVELGPSTLAFLAGLVKR